MHRKMLIVSKEDWFHERKENWKISVVSDMVKYYYYSIPVYIYICYPNLIFLTCIYCASCGYIDYISRQLGVFFWPIKGSISACISVKSTAIIWIIYLNWFHCVIIHLLISYSSHLIMEHDLSIFYIQTFFIYS